ncbi:MAG: amino acid--tRNA ligase-related protein [Candidatus Woesearchaeota archaeon]
MARVKSNQIQELPLETRVSLKGRIILKRDFGKRVFYTLKDDEGLVQVSLERGSFEKEENYKELKKGLSIGDIVSLDGITSLSNTGTPTLAIAEVDILTKCRKLLPDKDKGLNNYNQYTNRGLHLLTDKNALSKFRRLNFLRRSVRDYLHQQGYEEVDTGILKSVSDTSMSAEFVTTGNWTSSPLYLRKSTEMRLKQLMVGGLEKIFELGKEFRNEGVSSQFLPEFTALELYGAYLDYKDILNLTVGMMDRINEEVGEPESKPTHFWEVFLYGFIQEETKTDMRDASLEQIKELIHPEIFKEYSNHPAMRAFYIYDTFRSLLKKYPEQNIVLHGVPLEVSPLAKTFDNEPTLVEEFRYFVKGTSFCGGMTELTDPQEQCRRITNQAEYLGKSLDDIDNQFTELLEYGLPPCGGLGLSLERLMMIYAETKNIKEVVYFPL